MKRIYHKDMVWELVLASGIRLLGSYMECETVAVCQNESFKLNPAQDCEQPPHVRQYMDKNK